MPRLSKPVIVLLLFAVSLAIYANSLNGDFLLDDKLIIKVNEYIKDIRNLPRIITHQVFIFQSDPLENQYKLYRPVYILSFALDYFLFGLKPFGYHLTNVLMHSFTAFLVFLFILGFFKDYRLALLSSILFCLHPLHTETVSFISGRSEILVSMFSLLAVILYKKYASSGRGWFYFASLLSFIGAFLSREAGFLVFLPFLIFITGLKERLKARTLALHCASYLGIFAIYAILRMSVLVPIEMVPGSKYPFSWDVLNFLCVLMEYLRLLVFPVNLHIFRSIAPVSGFNLSSAFLPLSFLFALTAAFIFSLRKKAYPIAFGIGWTVIAFAYLIKFMHKFPPRIVMEEHWAYLPSIGFFLILAYIILRLKRPVLIWAALFLVIPAWAILTVINSGHWREEVSFYRYNLKFTQPMLSVIPRINFVIALYEHRLYNEAIAGAKELVAVNPYNWMSYAILGDTYMGMKRYAEAEEAYRSALKVDYFCWQVNRKLKALSEITGKPYKEEIDPVFTPAEAKIVSFIKMGDFAQALSVLNKELSVTPTPGLYTLAGITLGKMGKYAQSIAAFKAALKINPAYEPALANMGVSYAKMGLFSKADELFLRIENQNKKKDKRF
ncbi:MAG: tetratricopeptide repeat protein [Candidatus Omnitrophota bacterium]